LPGVVLAYDKALAQALIVSVATAAITIIGSLGMEWKSVKKSKKEGVENKSSEEGVAAQDNSKAMAESV
jgi:hypothetical protein